MIELSRRDLICGLATGAVVPFASGCAVNPTTGRRQFTLVSDAQIAELSATAWTDLRNSQPISRDPNMNRQLQRIGDSVTRAAGQGDQPWEFVVFDSDQVNAFVLPGGKVGFYRGLMELSENDAQIATVMGHEVGHVTARHAAERYSQQVAAGVGLSVIQAGLERGDVRGRQQIAGILGAGVQFGLILPYSRAHELEADRLGVDYMARAGDDARHSLAFWTRMESLGGQSPPELLSTHPVADTRIRELDAFIRQRGYA
ncbi:MAG: M48 family metallopeptidase [Maricaulaceae bacterium]